MPAHRSYASRVRDLRVLACLLLVAGLIATLAPTIGGRNIGGLGRARAQLINPVDLYQNFGAPPPGCNRPLYYHEFPDETRPGETTIGFPTVTPNGCVLPNSPAVVISSAKAVRQAGGKVYLTVSASSPAYSVVDKTIGPGSVAIDNYYGGRGIYRRWNPTDTKTEFAPSIQATCTDGHGYGGDVVWVDDTTPDCHLEFYDSYPNLDYWFRVTVQAGTAYPGPGYVGSSDVIVYVGKAKPVASFTVVSSPTVQGERTFTSTSTNPSGGPLNAVWDFGDNTGGTGTTITHQYLKPGSFTAKLTVTNAEGGTDIFTKIVEIGAPKLEVVMRQKDGSDAPVAPGATVDMELVVRATSDGVGSLHDVSFDGDALTFDPSLIEVVAGPNPNIATGMTLAPGQSIIYRYQLKTKRIGTVSFGGTAKGKDGADRAVTGTQASNLLIKDDVVGMKMTFDPSDLVMPEPVEPKAGETPKVKTVTVSIDVTNNGDDPLEGVTPLADLTIGWGVKTSIGIKPVKQVGGPVPTTLGSIAKGQTKTVKYQLEVSDDGVFDVDALVLSGPPARTSFSRGRLTVKPEKKLRFEIDLADDQKTGVVRAGGNIVLVGRVKNLTNTDTLDVEAPEPSEVTGNGGLPAVAFDGDVPNVENLGVPEITNLPPGESRVFTVFVPTSRSPVRPLKPGDPAAPGGTRATMTFDPSAKITDPDGQESRTTAADIEFVPGAKQFEAHIDDSQPTADVDYFEWAVVAAGAYSAGMMGTLANALVAFVRTPIDLLNLPGQLVYGSTAAVYLALNAWASWETEAWTAMTPAEKSAFLSENAPGTALGLGKIAEQAKTSTADRIQAAKNGMNAYLDELSIKMNTGSYREVVETTSKAGGSVAGAYIAMRGFAALAKSPYAVAAMARVRAGLALKAQEATAAALSLETLDAAGALLRSIAAGEELNATLLQKLYGVTEEQAAVISEISRKYKVLITLRARQADSIAKIAEGAVVKGEHIKAKNVNPIDVEFLGYEKGDMSTLAMRKPDVFREFEHPTDAQIDGWINNLVAERKAAGGSGLDEVLERELRERYKTRIKEWKNYGNRYTNPAFDEVLPDGRKIRKNYTNPGGVRENVGFRYSENGIPSTIKKDATQWRFVRTIAKATDPFYVVFEQRKLSGVWAFVSGDIDFIAITDLNGLPISNALKIQIYKILESPPINMQHGESGSHPKFAKEYLSEANHLKDGAYAQFGPDNGRRAVFINEKQSVPLTPDSNDTFSHYVWKGGYKHVGPTTEAATSPVNVPNLPNPDDIPLPIPKKRVTPGRNGNQAMVRGSGELAYSNDPNAEILRDNEDGTISSFEPAAGAVAETAVAPVEKVSAAPLITEVGAVLTVPTAPVPTVPTAPLPTVPEATVPSAVVAVPTVSTVPEAVVAVPPTTKATAAVATAAAAENAAPVTSAAPPSSEPPISTVGTGATTTVPTTTVTAAPATTTTSLQSATSTSSTTAPPASSSSTTTVPPDPSTTSTSSSSTTRLSTSSTAPKPAAAPAGPGTWVDTDLADQLDLGTTPIHVAVSPSAELKAAAPAGGKELVVNPDQEESPAFNDRNGWVIGQTIVINPGGDTEEYATITGFGSLLIAKGLLHAHAEGEMVAVVPGTTPAFVGTPGIPGTPGTPNTAPPVIVLPVPAVPNVPGAAPTVPTVPSAAPTVPTLSTGTGSTGAATTAPPAASGRAVSPAPTGAGAAGSATSTTTSSVFASVAGVTVLPATAAPAQAGDASLSYTGAPTDTLLTLGLAAMGLGLVLLVANGQGGRTRRKRRRPPAA